MIAGAPAPARRDDTEGAGAALTWLRAVDPKYRFGSPVFLQAQIMAVLGQRSDALRPLREAKAPFAAQGADVNPLVEVLRNPDFESRADDPDFRAVCAPKG